MEIIAEFCINLLKVHFEKIFNSLQTFSAILGYFFYDVYRPHFFISDLFE
jgi:hypothetical protein